MARPSKLHERVAQCLALIKPEGTYTSELCAATGLQDTRIGIIIGIAVADGRIFRARAGNAAVYFLSSAAAAECEARFAAQTAESRKQAQARYYKTRCPELKAQRSERRRAAKAAASSERLQQQAMRRAEQEITKARQRELREATAVERERARVEKISQKARLRAETKAAGALVFKAGTTGVAAKSGGPAMLAGELDRSRARVTIAPKPRDRFAPDVVHHHVSSSECRPWAAAACQRGAA